MNAEARRDRANGAGLICTKQIAKKSDLSNNPHSVISLGMRLGCQSPNVGFPAS